MKLNNVYDVSIKTNEAYTGHPIDERTEQIVMKYYINDDFNCSRQSPNKSDVITVKINDNYYILPILNSG